MRLEVIVINTYLAPRRPFFQEIVKNLTAAIVMNRFCYKNS